MGQLFNYFLFHESLPKMYLLKKYSTLPPPLEFKWWPPYQHSTKSWSTFHVSRGEGLDLLGVGFEACMKAFS